MKKISPLKNIGIFSQAMNYVESEEKGNIRIVDNISEFDLGRSWEDG